MPHTADELLTFAIVAAAAGYLARRAWGVFKSRRQGGCGSCAGCPSESAAIKREPQVFGIDQLLEPIARRPR